MAIKQKYIIKHLKGKVKPLHSSLPSENKSMAFGKRVKSNVSCSLLESPPHFFKVILPCALQNKMLMIPELFVRRFGRELTESATFIVPNGCHWPVRLKKYGREVWFHNGWSDFVKHYAISPGYFLVFKYEKNSSFYVFIFDMTACEINYPHKSGGSGFDKQEKKQYVEKSEGLCTEMRPQSTRKIRAKPTFCSTKGLGIKRNRQSSALLENSKVKHKCQPQSKKFKKEDLMMVKNESEDGNVYDLCASLGKLGIYVAERRRILAEAGKRAVKIARSLKLKKPTFIIFLKPSDIKYRDVYVPSKFAKKYFNRNARAIKVQVSDDQREQSFQMRWIRNGGSVITKGWAEVLKNKNLVVGDVCVFELIRRKDALLKLSIYQA